MAFPTKDGKRNFSMASRKRAYDMGHPAEEHRQMSATEPPDGGEEHDGHAVAEEHGPATVVNVEHADESGMHHVHSVHPDGHEHHSDHGSRKEAHEHAAKLAHGHPESPEEGEMAIMGDGATEE